MSMHIGEVRTGVREIRLSEPGYESFSVVLLRRCSGFEQNRDASFV